MKSLLLLILLPLAACSMYQMPDEDTLHTVPTTNNPNVTRDKGMSTPSFNY